MALNLEKSKVTFDYKRMNVTIVGNPKCGKSTFASKIGDDGSVYFAATEKGHDFLEIFKTDIKTWKDFSVLSDDLQKQKKFTHLVIDVIDNLYDMCVDYVCEINKVKAISEIPFGGGWNAVKKIIINEFNKLNQAGIGLTFITHVKDKEIKKDVVSWTAAGTSMANSIEEKVLGISDLILFCYIDKDGKRMMRTKPSKYIYAAGDRSGSLPEIMPLDAEILLKTLINAKTIKQKGETK